MFTLDGTSRQHVSFRKLVPNLLTTVSLCSGLASIHYSLRAAGLQLEYELVAAGKPLLAGQLAEIEAMWKTAMLAIGVAAVFDLLDGRAARLLRASSRFGAVYDSLSDFLSFGVAPAILIQQWMLRSHGALGMAAVLAFVLCAALRLARFTAMPKQPLSMSALSKFFSGLPTPAAAGAVLVPPMLDVAKYFPFTNGKGKLAPEVQGAFDSLEPALVMVNTFLIAALMVSRIPMFSFKKIRVKRSLVVPLMVAFGMVVLAMFRDPWLTIPVVVWCYLFTLPFATVAHKRIWAELGQHKPQATPAQESDHE
ncbi:MAG: phosphatidylcholine/phosphatidylserine synthase [Planctomycetota bacterium]